LDGYLIGLLGVHTAVNKLAGQFNDARGQSLTLFSFLGSQHLLGLRLRVFCRNTRGLDLGGKSGQLFFS
jgi:hypothetical protein